MTWRLLMVVVAYYDLERAILTGDKEVSQKSALHRSFTGLVSSPDVVTTRCRSIFK